MASPTLLLNCRKAGQRQGCGAVCAGPNHQQSIAPETVNGCTILAIIAMSVRLTVRRASARKVWEEPCASPNHDMTRGSSHG